MKTIYGILIISLALLMAATACFFSYRDYLKLKRLPEVQTVQIFAKTYSVAPSSCDDTPDGAQIKLDFDPSEPARNKIPNYMVDDSADQGRTVITFYNVSEIRKQFDYREITDNPLVDSINYYLKDGSFVMEIDRKGPFLPVGIQKKGSLASIFLEKGNENYPVIFNQRPADNSGAFPALRTISFQVSLADPLQKATVLLNNRPVQYSIKEMDVNKYLFEFREKVENNQEYRVKTVVTDALGRTGVSTWLFQGEIPVAATLGKDRFKYLGWWGRINSNGVSVRKGPSSASPQAGVLSSINTVKVIKEVFGDAAGYNNLWYEIDGGQFPHSYIFSDYVTPMVQPEPPAQFTIPDTVKQGDSWIDVDLSQKVLSLFAWDKPIFATYISPGKDENPTETGTFEVWYKLRKAEMKGGPPLHSYRYDLKNIPWVMYYNNSYAIHGTYWHDRFGMPMSAGCTNMTQGDAEYIFQMTKPDIPLDRQGLFTPKNSYGTVVHNH
jgi:hypothetical protein